MPTLHWNTRNADIRAAVRAPFHTLSAITKLGHGDAKAQNLLVQGDNLLALKALVPHYAGAVKCVYIDPPFNTGNAFENYDDNIEHTKWLGMMYPRFDLLHELLAENGSIWVSIDNTESDYMKVILDEIFGRKNFINLVTNTTGAGGFAATAQRIYSTANYIYAYAKNRKEFKMRRQFIPREFDTAYSKFMENPDDHYSKWRWRNLSDKVAERMGHESADKAKKAIAAVSSPQAARSAFKEEMARFAVENPNNVFRTAAIGGGAAIRRRATIEKSRKNTGRVFAHPGDEYNYRILNGEGIIFYKDAMKEVDGRNVPARILSDVWTDIPWTGIAGEGGVTLRGGKKPERLVERVLKLATNPGDLVLDSFLGSGTTAAVAHKMGRRWIGIEIGEQAETHCAKRLRTVVDGEDSSGITASAGWESGGGFRFSRLGPPIFAEDGSVHPEIKFPELAAHIWFSETRTPLPRMRKSTPFLGAHKGAGYALLYNGILKDKRVNGGNILVRRTLVECREAAMAGGLDSGGNLIIYGNGNRLGATAMREAGAEFRQIPYEVKKR